MTNQGSIVGRVVDAAGRPIAAARVVIVGGDQPFREIGAVTDAGGNFRFGAMLPGAYRLAAHSQNRSGSAHVVVHAGQQSDMEVAVP
jgi:protocatechuate 3,4-dioxygenase beta subunit